jgi:hypothetical protein
MSNRPDAGSIRPVSRLVSARVAPSLKVGLRPPRQKHAPGGFETGASVVEGGGGTGGAFPRMRARIEPTRAAQGSAACGTPVRSPIVPACTSPK